MGDEDQWSHIPSKRPRSEYVDKKAYGQVYKWELPQDKTNLQTATIKWQIAAFEPTAAGDGQSDKEEELPLLSGDDTRSGNICLKQRL